MELIIALAALYLMPLLFICYAIVEERQQRQMLIHRNHLYTITRMHNGTTRTRTVFLKHEGPRIYMRTNPNHRYQMLCYVDDVISLHRHAR